MNCSCRLLAVDTYCQWVVLLVRTPCTALLAVHGSSHRKCSKIGVGGAWLMTKMYFIIDCHTSPSWPNWWRFQTSTEHPSTCDDGVPARARKLPITKLALSEGLPRLDDQLDLRMTRVVHYIHPPKFDIDTKNDKNRWFGKCISFLLWLFWVSMA